MKASEATKILEVLTAMSKTAEAMKGLKGPNEREGEGDEDEEEEEAEGSDLNKLREEYIGVKKKVDAAFSKLIASKVEDSVKSLLSNLAAGKAPACVIMWANTGGVEINMHIPTPYVSDMLRAVESSKNSIMDKAF